MQLIKRILFGVRLPTSKSVVQIFSIVFKWSTHVVLQIRDVTAYGQCNDMQGCPPEQQSKQRLQKSQHNITKRTIYIILSSIRHQNHH
jgi:hypothetical protein